MSLLKETTITVPVLVVLLFVSHVFFGPDETYQPSTIRRTSWLGAVQVPEERFLAKDSFTGRASHADVASASLEQVSSGNLTPQARIRTVFAQFVSGMRRPAT